MKIAVVVCVDPIAIQLRQMPKNIAFTGVITCVYIHLARSLKNRLVIYQQAVPGKSLTWRMEEPHRERTRKPFLCASMAEHPVQMYKNVEM